MSWLVGSFGKTGFAVPYLFVPVIWTMPVGTCTGDSVRLTMISPIGGAQIRRDDQGTVAGHELAQVQRAHAAARRIVGESPRANLDLPRHHGLLRVGDDRAVFAELASAAAECTVGGGDGRQRVAKLDDIGTDVAQPSLVVPTEVATQAGTQVTFVAARRCRCSARLPASSYSSSLSSLLGSISSPLSHCQPLRGFARVWRLEAADPGLHARCLRLNQAMDVFVLRKRVDRCKLPENPVMFQRLGGRPWPHPRRCRRRRPPRRSGRRTRPRRSCDSPGCKSGAELASGENAASTIAARK